MNDPHAATTDRFRGKAALWQTALLTNTKLAHNNHNGGITVDRLDPCRA